jgi:uncharacterized membrane protein YdjX (TVP38/TMEM64 family)
VIAGLLALLWSAYDHEAVMAWLREAHPLPFFAAATLLPIFGVPISPFFILAGASFGRWPGLIGSELALAANLVICYWIARSGIRQWLVSLLQKFGHELPEFSESNKRTFRFILTVKLTPGPPQVVKNYTLGAARVPFNLFFGTSMLINGVYAALLVIVGESILSHQLSRALIAVAVVVVLAAAARWGLRKR